MTPAGSPRAAGRGWERSSGGTPSTPPPPPFLHPQPLPIGPVQPPARPGGHRKRLAAGILLCPGPGKRRGGASAGVRAPGASNGLWSWLAALLLRAARLPAALTATLPARGRLRARPDSTPPPAPKSYSRQPQETAVEADAGRGGALPCCPCPLAAAACHMPRRHDDLTSSFSLSCTACKHQHNGAAFALVPSDAEPVKSCLRLWFFRDLTN